VLRARRTTRNLVARPQAIFGRLDVKNINAHLASCCAAEQIALISLNNIASFGCAISYGLGSAARCAWRVRVKKSGSCLGTALRRGAASRRQRRVTSCEVSNERGGMGISGRQAGARAWRKANAHNDQHRGIRAAGATPWRAAGDGGELSATNGDGVKCDACRAHQASTARRQHQAGRARQRS